MILRSSPERYGHGTKVHQTGRDIFNVKCSCGYISETYRKFEDACADSDDHILLVVLRLAERRK